MKQIIQKLIDLQVNMDGRGISTPNMLKVMADFIEWDLEPIIERLVELEAWADDIERENIELRRKLRMYEREAV